MELWILHISHRHGDHYSIHSTAEDAGQALHAYCLEEWDEGLSEQYGAPDTLTREDSIDAYFEAWSTALDPETYRLEPCTLDITSGADDMQALDDVIEQLEHWMLGCDREDADSMAALHAARQERIVTCELMASHQALIEALGLAVTAMNNTPGFNTRILCEKTGRCMSSYHLLPQLEKTLEQAKAYPVDREALADALYRAEGYLAFPWGILDIRCAWADMHDAEPEDCPLTDEQCWAILERMSCDYDASIGINWDVIRYYLDEVAS